MKQGEGNRRNPNEENDGRDKRLQILNAAMRKKGR